MARMKFWFKKNWKYVAAASGVATMVAIKYFTDNYRVINRKDYSWIWALYTDDALEGKEPYPLKLGELIAIGMHSNYLVKKLRQDGIFNEELQLKYNGMYYEDPKHKEYCDILDSIPEYWS